MLMAAGGRIAFAGHRSADNVIAAGKRRRIAGREGIGHLLGSIFCQDHVPVTALPASSPIDEAPPISSSFSGSPYSKSPYGNTEIPRPASRVPGGAARGNVAPGEVYGNQPVTNPGAHPILALFLGFAPGIGAIYNGQYAKGLVHAVIFGVLISLASNSHNGGMQGFLGVMIATWVVYQAIEAYHTARKRRYGIEVEEFSSLFEGRHNHGRFPVGAIVLITVGFILLLNTTDLIDMEQFERYWPLLANRRRHLHALRAAESRSGNALRGTPKIPMEVYGDE